MPSAYSSPASPRASAARASRPSCTAAPARATTTSPSASQATRRKTPVSFTTTPGMPPPPSTVSGSACAVAVRTTSASSAAVPTCTSRSAGPPMRNEVWRASGSARRARAPSAATSARSPSAGAQRGRSASWACTRMASGSVDARERRAAAQQREELVGRAGDVARPEREHEVARVHHLEQRLGERRAGRDEADVEVAAAPQRLIERLARHALDPVFARGVDLGEQQHVRVVEGVEELGEEILGARVAMRLEGDDQPAREALARRAQRRADLGRVVPVVVDHEHLLLLAPHLEAAVHAAERRERPRADLEPDAELV